jgi:hypothetical protein
MLAWVPLYSGMTFVGRRADCQFSAVMPAKAGTHASLRKDDGEGEMITLRRVA